MDPAAGVTSGQYLNVNSTEWLDATTPEGRMNIVCHTTALVSKADGVVWGNGSSEDNV